jgi:hypothetical protein
LPAIVCEHSNRPSYPRGSFVTLRAGRAGKPRPEADAHCSAGRVSHKDRDAYARIRRILPPKDYVRLRPTAEHAIDAADASSAAAPVMHEVMHAKIESPAFAGLSVAGL